MAQGKILVRFKGMEFLNKDQFEEIVNLVSSSMGLPEVEKRLEVADQSLLSADTLQLVCMWRENWEHYAQSARLFGMLLAGKLREETGLNIRVFINHEAELHV